MELFEKTISILRNVWDNDDKRQQAKMVISVAIANVTDLSAKETQDVCDELDRLILPPTEGDNLPPNQAL